jgi:dihydrofolate reductase
MRKVILYIAISIDGFIARKDGGVDWLDAIPIPPNEDYGYQEFYDSLAVTLMGNETYKMVQNFGGPFPYPKTKNFVFTRDTSMKSNSDVTFVTDGITDFIHLLKQEQNDIVSEDGDIWLIGGGNINSYFLREDLIDEMHITIMPMLLGEGIPLFTSTSLEHFSNSWQRFGLKESLTYDNGVVMQKYYRQKEA